MTDALREWPADKVERRAVAALAPYAKNSRTHSEAQVAQLVASIKEWGWTVPVLVDEAGTIIAGHGRVLAAQKLGLAEVPVMVARGWTDQQRRAYVIADNKLAQQAGWNDDLLKEELAALKLDDFDLGVVGFSDDEVAALLAGPTPGSTDPDDTPEPPAEPVARLGDVWLLGRHRLACGDSTDKATVERVLAGVRPHLMVTDPPYGVKYRPGWRAQALQDGGRRAEGEVLNDDRADWREAWALFPGDVAYVWHADRFTHVVAESLEACAFEVRSLIIWGKTRFVLGRGHYHPMHEPCWYAVRKGGTGHWAGDRKQTTLWTIEHRRSETGHGTQKPVEAMRKPIENNSSPGQAVYEPFSGSGTTIIAAEMTGRSAHAVELNPACVDVGVRRWQEFTGGEATLEGDGRTFAAVAAERLAAEAA